MPKTAIQQYLRAINHKERSRIIKILIEGNANVTEIEILTGINQSRVSQHLRILRSCGLVESERDGKWIFYSLNQKRYKKVKDLIDETERKILKIKQP